MHISESWAYTDRQQMSLRGKNVVIFSSWAPERKPQDDARHKEKVKSLMPFDDSKTFFPPWSDGISHASIWLQLWPAAAVPYHQQGISA
jgi:hypothetical protein